ncbi:MAG: HAD family hydrolase [Armatimonadota bacterium]
MITILFDFDYTLADSSKGLLECVGYALRTSGLPVPDDREILVTCGMSLYDTFTLLAPDYSPDRLRKLFKERSDQVMADNTQLYACVPDLVMNLRSMGYRIGIVSTKYRYRIEGILKRDGLSHLFDIIIGGEDVTQFKPDPEGLLMAIDRLGCEKDSVTYVGDSIIDAKTARSAGVEFIAVTSGMTSAEDLAQHNPVHILPDVSAILSIL